jgi:cation:H+ antiporter
LFKKLPIIVAAVVDTMTPGANAISALWTFPSVIASAMLIAWAAEAAQFLISQGLALAVLAWLQTLPEFAVEGVIAWEAGKDPEKIRLVTANFTGSLRLLIGLGWPMIFATAAFFSRKRRNQVLHHIKLDDEHAVEVIGLLPPTLYFVFIWWKGTLTIFDSAVLTGFYLLYLYVLNKIPPRSEENLEDMERIPRAILALRPRMRNSAIVGLFLTGGLILYFVAHPFLNSMLALAASLGVSQFIFVQWVAPFLSEFPEKVSAFYWARRITSAPMALMNMVSSNINQWTVLVAMLPIVFGVSHGEMVPIEFDDQQKNEILHTLAQSLLGMMILANMRFTWYEALLLFVLWFLQFMVAEFRESVTVMYLIWGGVEILKLAIRRKSRPTAFNIFPRLIVKTT